MEDRSRHGRQTLIKLVLVPVLYAIFVLDLEWVKWEEREPEAEQEKAARAS